MEERYTPRPVTRNDDPPEENWPDDCEECGQPLDDCICELPEDAEAGLPDEDDEDDEEDEE